MMNSEYWFAAAIVLLLVSYLVYAVIYPERF
jgi:K+-transporting ATPase KdpF subunit